MTKKSDSKWSGKRRRDENWQMFDMNEFYSINREQSNKDSDNKGRPPPVTAPQTRRSLVYLWGSLDKTVSNLAPRWTPSTLQDRAPWWLPPVLTGQISLVLPCTLSKPLSINLNLHWVHILYNKQPTVVFVSRDEKALSALYRIIFFYHQIIKYYGFVSISTQDVESYNP